MSEHPDHTHGGVSLLQSFRRLFGRTSAPPASAGGHTGPPLPARLAAVERRLADLPAPGAAPDLEPIQAALAALEKQIAKAGREQFKANSLAEAEHEQTAAALDLLRAADARRDADLAALRAESGAKEAAVRLDVVRAILPALDGLDEALRAGEQVLAESAAPPRPATLMERMRAVQVGQPLSLSPQAAALRESLGAWLVGLTYVRMRLLHVLAAEGVRPMDAQGQPFDSARHVAFDVVPASDQYPPGTVTAELRRGYLSGDRVLRYAEVAVSR